MMILERSCKSQITFSLACGRERNMVDAEHQRESSSDKWECDLWYGLNQERRERVREVRRREMRRPSHASQGRGCHWDG